MEARQFEQSCKAAELMSMMHKFSPNCSFKYLQEPHRLELKFERSFTMAIKKNRTDLVQRFPKNTIKPVYVSMSQMNDLSAYQSLKKSDMKYSVITTPLHLACQMSNVEAARILLSDHNYDVNILLYNRNFLYDLLNTASQEDFMILANVFKERKPCVNSGDKIALNQAILKGNRQIIDTMLKFGNANPFARDVDSITPIHVACAKLDWETLVQLVKMGGDPLIPDNDGNTILHTLCMGNVTAEEYDFAKLCCYEWPLKLTRNNGGKTPLTIVRSMDADYGNIRSQQPNFKRRL